MFFDSHTHLNLAAFDSDREEVVERTRKQGVAVINIGTCYETSRKAVEMAQRYPDCWATVGLHPGHTFAMAIDRHELSAQDGQEMSVAESFDDRFTDLLSPRVVAIGECGLDYSYLEGFSPEKAAECRKKEDEEFRKQIRAAAKYDLPLSLHVRDLYVEALDILRDEKYEGAAVFHFFTGSEDQARQILERGFYLGFSGVITYSDRMNKVIEMAPAEKILIETDAPYVAPVPYKGSRNEPIYVKEVAKKIAQIKKIPLAEIEESTFQNARRLFRINP